MIKFRVKQELLTVEERLKEDSEIINRVKCHEFLYDTKHPDYRNLPMRDTVWTCISSEMNIRDSKSIRISLTTGNTRVTFPSPFSTPSFRKRRSETMESAEGKVLRCVPEIP